MKNEWDDFEVENKILKDIIDDLKKPTSLKQQNMNGVGSKFKYWNL